MNDKMNLKEFFYVIRKRKLTVIVTLLSITGFILITSLYVLKPSYQYSEQVLVGTADQPNAANAADKVQNTNQLVLSYIDLIKSPMNMAEVKNELQLKQSTYDLLKQISVSNTDNSQIITIAVKDSSPEKAKAIAKSVAEEGLLTFEKYTKVSGIQLLSDSSSQDEVEQLFPKTNVILSISLILGIFAGIGLAFLREFFDDAAYSERELESLGLPVLGRVTIKTSIRKNKSKQRIKPAPSRSSKKRGERVDFKVPNHTTTINHG